MAKYSIDMRLDRLLANEKAAAALEEIIPGLAARAAGQAQIAGLSPRKVMEYSKGAYPEALLELLEKRKE